MARDVKKLAKCIEEKLSKEELNDLCQFFDDGRIQELFEDYLLPEDIKNYPEQYTGDGDRR